MLAARAYRQGVAAGDHALASRAAALLDAQGKLPPDGTLLLLADAVSQNNWPRARLLADRVEHENPFAFMAPMLRAWIALGAHAGDPLAQLTIGVPRALALPYVGEHRALLLLATGRTDDGVAAIQALASPTGGRSARLDLAAAAELAAARHPDRALALLHGDDPATVVARALIAGGRPLPGAVDTPAQGIAELFVRVAADVSRDSATPLSLSLARLATLLAPRNAETWLVTANMLALAGQYPPALAALEHVAADDPFAAAARDLRVRLLMQQGDQPAALAEALAAVTRHDADLGDWSRVGDVYVDLGRQRDAADAYRRAITLAEADPRAAPTAWTLWLRLGGALEQAGDWAAARPALARAVALAPDQAPALNYLGYAELERRESLPEAERLIARASTLRPDDSATTDSLGWSYYVRGDLPHAIATLERAVIGAPGEPTINEHLGDAYWAAGRRYEARGAWAAALVYAEGKDAPRIRAKIATGAARAAP